MSYFSTARDGLHRYVKPTCAWLLLVSVASMHPLLLKDGMSLPAAALSAFFLVWCCFSGIIGDHANPPPAVPAGRVSRRVAPIPKPTAGLVPPSWMDKGFSVCLWLSMMVMVLLCLGPISRIGLPARYPDLWTVLVSAFSCAHFIVFMIYFNLVQLVGGDGRNKTVISGKKYQ